MKWILFGLLLIALVLSYTANELAQRAFQEVLR